MDISRGSGVNWILRSLHSFVWSVIDAIPPYHISDGPLENKEIDPSGKCFITVNAAKVEVDENTFELLVIGETLRVRYTRGHHAISIDRVLPGRGPG